MTIRCFRSKLIGCVGLVGAILVLVGMLFTARCLQNASYQQAWREYIARHSQGSTSSPSEFANELVRYQDTSVTFRSKLGESRSPFGYVDKNGDVQIAAKYAACARVFSEGFAWAFRKDGTGVYIRPDGTIAFEVEAAGLFDFKNGRARIRIVDSSSFTSDGFVDMNGNLAISPKYRDATDFVNGFALVTHPTLASDLLEYIVYNTGIGGNICFAYRVGIIDKDGKSVSANQFQSR